MIVLESNQKKLQSKKRAKIKSTIMTEKDSSNNSEMPILEHFAELRVRLIYISSFIIIFSIVAFYFNALLFDLIKAPITQNFSSASLIGTGPAEAFMTKLKIAFFFGFVASTPFVFHQLWLFISPGLHQTEKKYAIPFIIGTSLLFISGALFCYFFVIPFALAFFGQEFESIGLNPQIKIGEYITFITRLILVFGAVFELPILAFFLSKIGIINSKLLKDKFRYAVVAIFIIAAILTPPDIITQTLLAIPLIGLYGISIFFAKIAEKK